jgi:hypothetical protein
VRELTALFKTEKFSSDSHHFDTLKVRLFARLYILLYFSGSNNEVTVANGCSGKQFDDALLKKQTGSIGWKMAEMSPRDESDHSFWSTR